MPGSGHLPVEENGFARRQGYGFLFYLCDVVGLLLRSDFSPFGVTGADSVLKQSEQCPVYLVGNESEVLRLMLIVELVDIDG